MMRHLGGPTRATAILVCMILSWTCRKNPVGPQVTPNVQLSVDYVACTEVWLKLGFTDGPEGGDYPIMRDGATTLQGSFSGTSTVVYDTTVSAGKSYSYIAYRIVNGQVKQISPSLEVTTLDSTSNNFAWQVIGFGGSAGSCLLKDVTIVNDSEIWATGAVYLQDSTANTTFTPYNLVHWNGHQWGVGRVKDFPPGSIGDSVTGIGTAIVASRTNELWLVADVVFHYVDSTWSPVYGTGADGTNRLWGDVSEGQWFVGRSGTMVLHSPLGWEKVSSGTSLDIQDVWRTLDAAGVAQIVAVACDRFTNDGSAVLKLSGSSVTNIQTTGLPLNLSSVWSATGKEWYVCGDALYKTRSLTSPWQQVSGLPSFYMESMRGNGPNDIFVVGDFGLVLHFNGSTWTDLTQQVSIPNSVFYAVATKGNTVVAVGQYTSGTVGQGVGGAALIVIGKRN